MQLKFLKKDIHVKPEIALLIFPVFYLIVFAKSLIALMVFCIVDFIGSYLTSKTKMDMPFDAVLLGLIYFAYFNPNIAYLAILLIWMIILRMIHSRVEFRHLVKAVVFAFIWVFVMFLSNLPIVFISVLAYLIRFILEYILMYMFFGEISFSRLPSRIMQIIVCYLVFMYIF